MIELLTSPAVTMPAAAVGGFLMKLKALENQRKHERRLWKLDAYKAFIEHGSKSADSASNRLDAWGKLTRRILAFAFISAVIGMAFIPGFIDKPSVIETVKETGGWFFGLFPERTKTEFVTVNGFVHVKELLVGLTHVTAFYFGQAAAKP